MYQKSLTFLLCLLFCRAAQALTSSANSLSGKQTDATFELTSFNKNCQIETSEFSPNESIDLIWSMKPDINDAGQEADLLIIASLNGQWFMKTKSGAWEPWDSNIASLKSYKSLSLPAELRNETIVSGLTGLAGNFAIHVAYTVGSEIIYNALPLVFSISNQANSNESNTFPCGMKQGDIQLNSFLTEDPAQTQRNTYNMGDQLTLTALINADADTTTGSIYLFGKNKKNGVIYSYNTQWTSFDPKHLIPLNDVTLPMQKPLTLFSQILTGLEGEFEFYVAFATQNNPAFSDMLVSQAYLVTVTENVKQTGTGTETPVPTDKTPDPFYFTDQTGAAPSTLYESNAITVTGIDAGVVLPVNISNGEYSINQGVYSEEAGTVGKGDKITVKLLSSANEGTITEAKLTIAGISDTFSIKTNTSPSIQQPANQSININASVTFPVAFSDAETESKDLQLGASSSNTSLIDVSGIILAGDSEKTLTLKPKSNQSGSAIITLSVSDGTLTSQVTFNLTVNPGSNTAPTVIAPANQTINQDTTTGPLNITIQDAETAPESLILTALSDDTALIDSSGIVLAGTGTARTITLTPKSGQIGSAMITLTVSDGSLTGQATFNLNVNISAPPPPPPPS